jgi:hypothetical protein
MFDKGVVVLQNCADEVVPGSNSETFVASSGDENQVIGIKVEDVTDIEIKEDAIPETFSVIKDEYEVSCISV